MDDERIPQTDEPSATYTWSQQETTSLSDQTAEQPTQTSAAAAHYAAPAAGDAYQAQAADAQATYDQQAGYTQQAPYQQVSYQDPYQQQYQQAAYEVPQQPVSEVAYEQPVAKAPRTGLRSALFGLAGGAVGALAVVLALRGTGLLGTTRVVTESSSAGQTISITANEQDITVAQAVAAKALPSVVSVYVTSDEGSGMGSGVILDTEGNILTNWHVAGDATSISVTIAGKSYDATLVGGDASSDLAVVHADLQGDTVTPMEIGDSDQLVVGDWVMTIGSPFGLDQSVSAGIVSSLARNEMMTSTYGTTIYANLIQTDASINPGNSGGALVNSRGQLVGISTLFSSDTESFAGIGFAIPGNYAVDIANKIIAGEQVTHAYIGLSMQTVNAQNAAANNLSVNQGAYVAEVTEGSPADVAGIKAGDIVIAMGGQQITSADGMILAVRSHSIGETVAVTVMRGEEELTFDVTLGSDEQLQALQQQQLEQQQQQQQQYLEDPYGNGYGNGDGYQRDILEELYEYLYNNNHGGSYELGE